MWFLHLFSPLCSHKGIGITLIISPRSARTSRAKRPLCPPRLATFLMCGQLVEWGAASGLAEGPWTHPWIHMLRCPWARHWTRSRWIRGTMHSPWLRPPLFEWEWEGMQSSFSGGIYSVKGLQQETEFLAEGCKQSLACFNWHLFFKIDVNKLIWSENSMSFFWHQSWGGRTYSNNNIKN